MGNVQASDVLKINVKMVDRLVSTCLSELCRGAALRSSRYVPKSESPVVNHSLSHSTIHDHDSLLQKP
jgi:hypothetical protein